MLEVESTSEAKAVLAAGSISNPRTAVVEFMSAVTGMLAAEFMSELTDILVDESMPEVIGMLAAEFMSGIKGMFAPEFISGVKGIFPPAFGVARGVESLVLYPSEDPASAFVLRFETDSGSVLNESVLRAEGLGENFSTETSERLCLDSCCTPSKYDVTTWGRYCFSFEGSSKMDVLFSSSKLLG